MLLRDIVRKVVVIFAACLFFISCSEEVMDGDGFVNYPNMQIIYNENMKPMHKSLQTFRMVTSIKNKKDTQNIASNKVDWPYWEQCFLQADIYKKEFDKKYKIIVTHDTTLNSITYTYASLDPSLKTKRFSIVASSIDNSMRSIYVETAESGFISSESFKILFIPGKLIQVQEYIKKPFKKATQQIRTLEYAEY